MVTVAAIVLGRERANRRTAASLGLASGGLFLVLAGAGAGALDPLGTLLGISAAVIYSTYILVSGGVAERLGPLVLSALVCTGAATTLTLGTAAGGSLRLGDVSAAGFGWLAGIAVVSTVGAVSLFFAGLRRVGPSTASILSTAEPLTTVLLAASVVRRVARARAAGRRGARARRGAGARRAGRRRPHSRPRRHMKWRAGCLHP